MFECVNPLPKMWHQVVQDIYEPSIIDKFDSICGLGLCLFELFAVHDMRV